MNMIKIHLMTLLYRRPCSKTCYYVSFWRQNYLANYDPFSRDNLGYLGCVYVWRGGGEGGGWLARLNQWQYIIDFELNSY